MIGAITIAARVVGATAFATLAVLHAIWASGSPWPAKTRDELAEVVIGQPKAIPGTAPTAVVAVGSAGVSLLASGALGHGRMQRLGLRAAGAALLLRAIGGGDAALELMGLPPAGERFLRLDRQYYRPFAALLGMALWVVAAGMKRYSNRSKVRHNDG